MGKQLAKKQYPLDSLRQFQSGNRILRDENAEKSRVKFIQEDGDFKTGEEYFNFQVTCGYLPERNTFQVRADIQLPKCREIQMYGELVDAETFDVLEKLEDIRADETNRLSYLVTEELHLSEGKSIDDVLVVVNAGWIVEGETAEEWATAMETFTESPFVKDVEVIHPQKQKGMLSNGNDTINIALSCEPDDRTDLDYLCKFGKNAQGQPYFMVPTKGSVSADSTTIRIKNAQASCFLTDRGNDFGYYMVAGSGNLIPEQKIKTTISGMKVSWECLDKWDSAFLYEGGWKEHIFDYLMLLKIEWTVSGSSKINRSYFAVTSSDQMQFEAECYRKIPPVSIMWGCLVENTLISMCDGTQREVRYLRKGDRVKTENGMATIRTVWRGLEDQCLTVLMKGRILQLTPDHPVLTREGWKRADKLEVQDEVKTENGTYAEVAGTRIFAFPLKVYNVSYEQEGDMTLIANGLVVGNFDAQNKPGLYKD
ncbi:MAG: hypothetical protein J6C00_09565 [Eubacterium sp.]|nr:hypothetical protein [Eubacterium sp.]